MGEQEFVDGIVGEFKGLWKDLDITVPWRAREGSEERGEEEARSEDVRMEERWSTRLPPSRIEEAGG